MGSRRLTVSDPALKAIAGTRQSCSHTRDQRTRAVTATSIRSRMAAECGFFLWLGCTQYAVCVMSYGIVGGYSIRISRRYRLAERQREREGRAFSQLALQPHGAAVQLDKPLTDR